MSARFTFCLAFLVLGGCYLSHTPPSDASADAGTDLGLINPVADSGVLADSGSDLGPDLLIRVDAGCELDPDECDLAATLDGLRWELPCSGDTEWPEVCQTVNQTQDETVFAPRLRGRSFLVTLRFRGVVETKEYLGGRVEGPFSIGGTPDDTSWNSYSLRTSSPARVYYLNHGPREPFFCVAIDYVQEIEISAGSVVELESRVFDARQIRNRDEEGDSILVDGVAPAPATFDGQFIQMDVVGIREI